jgi:AcrR family transcriptional regulator
MPKPSPSERLESIATAAIEAFGRLGFRGTRTADVAARAGLSAGSLFTYVESKEALFHLVFLYALDLLPESPELPLPTPEPGETVALFAQALQDVPVSRIRAALAVRETDDAGEELRGIVEELYDTMERYWPLLAVVERCSREIPELNALWFGEGRIGIYSDLAEYLRRRAASGQLRQMPDSTMAARLIGELVAWFAWHRHEDHDAALYDDENARRTVIEFACAALVPNGARQRARDSNHHADRSTSHEGSH